MLPDRYQTFLERVAHHRRFFVPASICLFLVYPGSLAALLPSSQTAITFPQRIETLLLYLPLALIYSGLLATALPREVKVAFGFLVYGLGALLLLLLLRTNVFSMNFHQVLLRADIWLQFLPGLLMFLFLCVLDQKKRARSIFWGLIVLIVPLSLYSANHKKGVLFLDNLRYSDVVDRRLENEPWNQAMQEQCDLVSDNNLRAKCHVAIHSGSRSHMYCSETDNDCQLSRREEEMNKKLSGHPAPVKNSAPGQQH